MPRPARLRLLALSAAALVAAATAGVGALAAPAAAETYVPISGAGSTWSQNALDQWRRNVNQYGLKVNYQGSGSSDGRNQFRNGTTDYAVSEIPYGLSDGGVVDAPPQRKYAYMPIVAGGTALMYNLKIGGKRVTNLRLSGPVLASMFTGEITRWDDARVKADNPGLALPARQVVPVVRSDGSGTTAQFTTWMSKRHAASWDGWCRKAGRGTPCGVTSNYPVVPGRGFVAQSGSLGVAGYVSQGQSEGAITYVEYSYALNSGYPVAKVLNDAGFYTEPTPSNVAVGLLAARINDDQRTPQYLTQILDGVYANRDRRSYQLSSYSYMVVPTEVAGTFNTSKGKSLADFAYYFLCEGQQQAPVLGFSPLPINLVQAGLQQVRKIPGADAQNVDIKKCNNPTFSPTGQNLLAARAPQPAACDQRGPQQCGTGTGGAKQATAVKPAAAAVAGPAAARATTAQGGVPAAGAPGAAAGAGAAPGAPAAAAGGSGTATGPVLAAGTTAGAAAADPGLPVVDADGVTTVPQVALAGGSDAVAVPVALTDTAPGGTAGALMAVAATVLLAVTLVPPLLSRRLRAADARTDA